MTTPPRPSTSISMSTAAEFCKQTGLEIIHLHQLGDWREAQLALNGKKCAPFQFHEGDFRAMDEKGLLAYLHRSARNMLSLYGDVRNGEPIMEPDGSLPN